MKKFFIICLTFFSVAFLFNSITISADETATKKITITKQWIDDEEEVRPDNITVHIKKTTADLITGLELETKIKSLSGSGATNTDNTTVKAIKKATLAQYNAKKNSLTANNEVQASGEKVYMWYENNTIYFYSEADNIYMNPNSASAFRKLTKLEDISGLSSFNTSYVKDMNRMFQNDYEIVDLSSISGWNVSQVTDMTFTFGSSLTGTSMKISSLDPLANWDVSSVQKFDQTFKICASVKTLKPIKNWNVSNVTTFNQMFNRAGLTDATDIENWNAVRVTSFNMMFANMSATLPSDKMPIFTNRPGSWTSGSYTATTAPLTDTVSVPAIVRSSNEQVSSGSWVKNGSTWTYEFTVADDGSIYKAYEEAVSDYNGSAYETSPVTVTNDAATITNTYTKKKEITVTKVWDDLEDSQRPDNIKVHIGKPNSTYDKVSNDSSWVKNGSTWTYKFNIYGDDVHNIWEEDVNNYTSSVSSSNPLVINGDVSITNTIKKEKLTIKKQQIGNMADIEEESEYTIKISDKNGNPISGMFNVKDKNGNRTVNISSSGYKVNLKHGEDFSVLDIPTNYKYSVSESSDSEYTQQYLVEDNDGVIVDLTAGNNVSRTISKDEIVTFKDSLEKATSTGIFIKIFPFFLLIISGMVGIFVKNYFAKVLNEA